MVFTDCEFTDTKAYLEKARYEHCVFNIQENDPLPPAWQCMDCLVVCGGEIALYGFGAN